ncbi:MAG: hypothetical protein V4689_01070 [Verrucomicrobiota bacterium]
MNFATTSKPATNLAEGNALLAKTRLGNRGSKTQVPRSGKMEGPVIREKIAKHGMRNSNVLATAAAAGAKTFTAQERTPARLTRCSTAAPVRPASNWA